MASGDNWLTTLAHLQQQQVPAVMVTVVSVTGSTPREVSAKVIVTETELFGTIGGGNLEHQATAIAREQLEVSQPQQLRRFPLGAGLGQCCGGLVNLLFEPIVESTLWVAQAQALQLKGQDWVRAVATSGEHDCTLLTKNDLESSRSELKGYYYETIKNVDFELLVFGAGHVGKAIVKIMSDMPFIIKWIDSREDQFPPEIPSNIEVICTDTPEAEINAAPANSFFLVMTHDHGLDQTLAEQILKRSDFTYFGLIGSNTKRRMFEKRMTRRGISPDRFDDMICPIGIDGIRGKQPATIAVSVAAQLMTIHDQLAAQSATQPTDQPFQQPTRLGSVI